jgi:hypothetical protein
LRHPSRWGRHCGHGRHRRCAKRCDDRQLAKRLRRAKPQAAMLTCRYGFHMTLRSHCSPTFLWEVDTLNQERAQGATLLCACVLARQLAVGLCTLTVQCAIPPQHTSPSAVATLTVQCAIPPQHTSPSAVAMSKQRYHIDIVREPVPAAINAPTATRSPQQARPTRGAMRCTSRHSGGIGRFCGDAAPLYASATWHSMYFGGVCGCRRPKAAGHCTSLRWIIFLQIDTLLQDRRTAHKKHVIVALELACGTLLKAPAGSAIAQRRQSAPSLRRGPQGRQEIPRPWLISYACPSLQHSTSRIGRR